MLASMSIGVFALGLLAFMLWIEVKQLVSKDNKLEYFSEMFDWIKRDRHDWALPYTNDFSGNYPSARLDLL